MMGTVIIAVGDNCLTIGEVGPALGTRQTQGWPRVLPHPQKTAGRDCLQPAVIACAKLAVPHGFEP